MMEFRKFFLRVGAYEAKKRGLCVKRVVDIVNETADRPEPVAKVINRAVAEAIGGLANIFGRGNTHAVLPLAEI